MSQIPRSPISRQAIETLSQALCLIGLLSLLRMST